MLPDYQALSWVVLCPIAIVTNCFGVIIISHYRSSYIGTDMVLITLLLAMAANAGILLLVPAVYVMLNINWSSGLCFFYIWIFGFLRAVGLIGLFVLSFHWSHVSKLTPLNRIQTPSFPIKSSLLVTVIISVIVGILPLARILMRPDPIDENLPCMFLPYDADPTLAIFIIILTLVVFFAIIICLIDSGLLLHSYKSMFLLKYKSGGFYDTERARATWSRTGIVSDTYSEINNTFDLWRVVLLQFLLSTLINHIPYLCIEFVQLFSQNAHTEVLMLTVQWLQMMECMLFPFTLLLGARYRHAFGHICRYMFLCDRSVCEKESTCKLQSYRLKAHIQEQSLKFQENLASKNAQSHPSKSRNKNGLTILTEEERTLPSEQDTNTRVEADVHIYSTTPTRHLLSVSTPRRKQFQANINLNLEHTASTSMLPSVAIKQQHRASISPAVETLNKKQQSPSSASVSIVVHNNDDDANNYSNNSSAEGQLIASKPSSPVNSESSSPHISELFDEDDIAEVLDRSPSPPPHPLTPPPSTPPKGYEMAVLGASIPSNIATTSTDGANAATSSSNSKKDYGSDDNNDNDGVKELPTVISLRTPMVAKAQSKHQLTAPHGDIWTSTSQCLPTAPPGISFDFHGPKPYFEPISENSSPINDDTHSKGLQSADLYKAKLPYMRSESFLQAMSSSSAYGGNPKPVAKFKLFSKVITSFSWLKNMTLQRNLPSSHSFESTDNPPNSSMFPMFGRRHKSEEEKEEEEEEEEDQSKYTLTAQPITHSRHKRVAFQQNDSPKFQMAEDNLERKSKEGNDTTADSQSAAISSATSVTSLLSQNNSDRKDHNTLTGVANLGADFTDSVFEESSAETQKDNLNTDRSDREELVDVRRKTVNDSDPRIEERRTLNRSPLHQPESTNKQHENTIVSNRKLPFLRSHLSKNTAAGDRKKNSTPNLTASQPPPVLPKCKSPPFPPPPPPPLPLSPPPPPPLSSSAAKTNPASLYKNYPCNAHSESPNQNSQFKSSTEAHFQKRPSLITTELLVTHDIIKRLRNQSEKQMESSSDNADMSAQISIYTTTTGNYLQSDEDKLVSDSVHDSLILSSSSRMYRSVSDESIFSHIGSETKEMPPSLSKATDDLTMAGFSDINRSLFWPNLKNTQQGTRSANDLHLIAYVPPIASRTIPVQKVKALQAASPERTVDNKLKYPGYETSKKLEDDDEEEVSESSSADSLKYLKILKKIEQEPDKEKVEWLRNELMDVDTLQTSPVFIRTLEKELLARKRSTEKVEKPLMASVQAVEGPEKLLPQPSLYNIDDGSPRALRKFLAEVIAKRQDIPEPGVASSHSSPFSTAPQSPTYMSSSGTDTTVNSGQAGHRTKAVVDVKTIV